ncbi:hypothetical protein D3C76_128570 [compost metagenome]
MVLRGNGTYYSSFRVYSGFMDIKTCEMASWPNMDCAVIPGENYVVPYLEASGMGWQAYHEEVANFGQACYDAREGGHNLDTLHTLAF